MDAKTADAVADFRHQYPSATDEEIARYIAHLEADLYEYA